MGRIIPYIMENKQCLKPQTRLLSHLVAILTKHPGGWSFLWVGSEGSASQHSHDSLGSKQWQCIHDIRLQTSEEIRIYNILQQAFSTRHATNSG